MKSVESWLSPFPDDPLERIAARVSSDQPRPVDVHEILRSRIAVKELSWPQEVDALIVWLDGEPQKVLLRKTPIHSRRRQRMTVAHELGHIVIPWHIGYGPADCHEDSVADGTGHIAMMEQEARAIAGCILMPYEQIKQFAISSRNLQQFFESFEEFETSAWAVAIRLTQVMRPGFMFRGPFGSNHPVVMSPGTGEAPFDSLLLDAAASGEFDIGGKKIEWLLATDPPTFQMSTDPRRASEILKTIVADLFPADSKSQREKLFLSLQGKIGGGLSKGVFDSVLAVNNQAHQKARTAVPQNVRDHPDWETYLAKTVANRASKLGLL